MKSSLIFAGIISMLFIGITLCQQPPPNTTFASSLEALVGQGIDQVGRKDLDEDEVSAVHKAGADYLRKLQLSGDARVQFLMSNISQQLLEEEKRQITIKILLADLSAQKVKPEECADMARYLRRQMLGDTDSAIVGCMLMLDMGGNRILSLQDWKASLQIFLKQQDYIKTTLVGTLLKEAEEEHKLDFAMLSDPAWTDEEKQEIADASLAAQRRILARRYLEGARAH